MPKYKLVIYGQPAVGKSMFALGWSNPFFICTDDNYDFLEDFGAKPENHVKLHSWAEFKKFVATFDSSKYDTIVVDLMEDLYSWCEYEYLSKNKIEDLSDVGYGKGYKIVRNDFATTMLKVINFDCNFIGLTHEDITKGKTNRGIEYTEYAPSSLIPDKCWTLINGRLRFCFRAHLEEQVSIDGKIIRKRLLSVSPKPHEFQINRGMNVDSLPDDISLSYKEFCDIFGVPDRLKTKPVEVNAPTPKSEPTKTKNLVATPNDIEKLKEIATKKEEPKSATTLAVPKTSTEMLNQLKAEALEPKVEPIKETTQVSPVQSESDKKQNGLEQLAKIKAMLEAKKKGANN